MINAIIMDVDGVIVGKTQGVNFPLPNKKVIRALKDLQEKNIPVVLCTAKFNYAVRDIILQAELRNPHITDGGALIIDPLENKVVKEHIIDIKLVENIVEKAVDEGYYTEVYGTNDYYLQKNHVSEFTDKRIRILQKEHIAVDSLLKVVKDIDVIKVMIFIHNQNDKNRVDELLKQFASKIHYVWSRHPTTNPAENAVITIKGVSKKAASLEVLDYLKISPEETLGVGDTESDWNFMSLCKYAGVVGNASEELKQLAKQKGEGKYFFGPSVEEDGFLQIVNHFIK